MIYPKSRAALAAGFLSLSVLLVATGCEPASQPANLSRTTMVFRDQRSSETVYTCVVTDHRAVLIVEPASASHGKSSPERKFYAQEKMDEQVYAHCSILSGFAGDAEATGATNLPNGFERALYANVAVGRIQPPADVVGFTQQHACRYRFEKVRAALEQNANVVEALPNWVYASEPTVAQLGLR